MNAKFTLIYQRPFKVESATCHSINLPFDAEVAEKFLHGFYYLCCICTVFCIHVLRENASYYIFAKDKLLLPSNLERYLCKIVNLRLERMKNVIAATIFSLLIVSPFFPSLWDFLHYTFAKGPNQNTNMKYLPVLPEFCSILGHGMNLHSLLLLIIHDLTVFIFRQ